MVWTGWRAWLRTALATAGLLWAAFQAKPAAAFTANKVWYELLPTGIYRVHVIYTVPELKEFRESYVEYRTQKEAESLYWDLIRGMDFYPPAPASRRFVQPSMKPDPW